ncbi:MAG: hypothetical protein KGK03_09485 [Candidatus Omnitrophica bacterium]|nr:hypothetical protein [Candidatus Omnitrophota bacterium]
MKRSLWTLLLLLMSWWLKGLQGSNRGYVHLAKLKMSLIYVRFIKTFRLLFLSLLGLGVGIILLLAGLVLLHVSLFLYAPWSTETKLAVGLLCAAAYLIATLVLFYQIFSSDKWLKIFHVDAIMDHLRKEDYLKEHV